MPAPDYLTELSCHVDFISGPMAPIGCPSRGRMMVEAGFIGRRLLLEADGEQRESLITGVTLKVLLVPLTGWVISVETSVRP